MASFNEISAEVRGTTKLESFEFLTPRASNEERGQPPAILHP
jgi:hypothetical protein